MSTDFHHSIAGVLVTYACSSKKDGAIGTSRTLESVVYALFRKAVQGHLMMQQILGWRKIHTKFSGKRRDARENFVIGVVFDGILNEKSIEMQRKCCQTLNFRI